MDAICIANTKLCLKCNNEKPIDQFTEVQDGKYRRNICIACENQTRRERRAAISPEERKRRNALSAIRKARSWAKKPREQQLAIRREETRRKAEREGKDYLPLADRQQRAAERKAEKEANRKPRHGMSGTPEYKAYSQAKDRCTNPRNAWWHCYGGRGIRMKFNSFPEIYAYLGPRAPGHSLDRIDPNGHYEPGNVRWHPRENDGRNRRPSSEWRVHPSVSARKGVEMRRAAKAAAGGCEGNKETVNRKLSVYINSLGPT